MRLRKRPASATIEGMKARPDVAGSRSSSGSGLASGTRQEKGDMSNRLTHEQVAALDAQGERHVVLVTRSSIPGSPHLKGPPHYTWHEGQVLHLVDAKSGILECALTGQRLQIEAWRG
jgi:hypothetical protein